MSKCEKYKYIDGFLWICRTLPKIAEDDMEEVFYALDDSGDFKVTSASILWYKKYEGRGHYEIIYPQMKLKAAALFTIYNIS